MYFFPGLLPVSDPPGLFHAMQELWLQGNALTSLPDALCSLPSLAQLSVADNALTSLPEV